jgi:hypothetical protein
MRRSTLKNLAVRPIRRSPRLTRQRLPAVGPAKEGADAYEGEAFAVRAAQVPLHRFGGGAATMIGFCRRGMQHESDRSELEARPDPSSVHGEMEEPPPLKLPVFVFARRSLL